VAVPGTTTCVTSVRLQLTSLDGGAFAPGCSINGGYTAIFNGVSASAWSVHDCSMCMRI
jgi:hypothetical protein